MVTVKISAVINTYNEEKNIKRCLDSVKNFADEMVIVDMHSEDKTVEIAKGFGAKVFQHDHTRYVEPARNFALSKASGDWIFLIDADEELRNKLADQLKWIAVEGEADYVEIPRKNIIFGKWIEHSRWWPDYLIRFFRKGQVTFSDKIHLPPIARGKSIKMEPLEENSLIHYNFQSISQFIKRLNRYTDIQANEVSSNNYHFEWTDLIIKPVNEFFSRFFAGEGYKDGLHGLALSLLQAFSELVLYLKIWEKQGFKESKIEGFSKVFEKSLADYYHWQQKITPNPLSKVRLKIKSKL